jgi:hypothetical protein
VTPLNVFFFFFSVGVALQLQVRDLFFSWQF